MFALPDSQDVARSDQMFMGMHRLKSSNAGRRVWPTPAGYLGLYVRARDR